MTKHILLSVVVLALCCSMKCSSVENDQTVTDEQIDISWQSGKTLPASVFDRYPLPAQKIRSDRGLNVMVDLAHQCTFATMWELTGRLKQQGFRAIGNQASLHTVLDPDGQSRVRFIWDEDQKIYPFAWHPNFEYNVIITYQNDAKSQDYLPEELEALEKFVRDGGGLIITMVAPRNQQDIESWPLNKLCKMFGAGIKPEKDSYRGTDYAVIEYGEDWQVSAMGDGGQPVIVSRSLQKGYITIIGHDELLRVNRRDEQEAKEKNELLVAEILKVAQGKQPVGGEPCYPESRGGGGGIYPEIEKHFDDIVLFYAANQKPELLRTVEEDIPKAKSLIESWLPSKPTLEPMYLILSSGGGGGWAVNAFRPKENGIISLSPEGIISIFAHELAHTMHGPVNNNGIVAGIAPIPNRGEAHAGWFQGKIDAWFDKNLQKEPVKKCNNLFDFDPEGNKLDLVTHYENEKLNTEYGKGKDWTKTWWIWQKLDDRYGTTWYPRWKWVQHTRWKEQPEHRLSWEEMAEDMSIAVGEDLFPFLKAAGLSLKKSRLETINFEGRELTLEVAPIDVSKAGAVRLEEIGDYTQAITPLTVR